MSRQEDPMIRGISFVMLLIFEMIGLLLATFFLPYPLAQIATATLTKVNTGVGLFFQLAIPFSIIGGLILGIMGTVRRIIQGG